MRFANIIHNRTKEYFLKEAFDNLSNSVENLIQLDRVIPFKDPSTFKLELNIQGSVKIFHSIYRSEIRKYQIPQFITESKKWQYFILFAEVIGREVRKILRQNNVAFADGTGLLFIPYTGMYILLEQPAEVKRRGKKGSKWTKSITRTIFQLLLEPDLLRENYRIIADRAGVSLDTVSKTFRLLNREEHILQVDQRSYKFINHEKLFMKWLNAYEDRLRPSLSLGVYRFNKTVVDWRNINLNNSCSLWSGEPGAEVITGQLVPEKFILYSTASKPVLMKHNQLVPDNEGNVFVFDKFWLYKLQGQSQTAPFLLIYADLLLEGMGRDLEIADTIKTKYLDGFFTSEN